MNKFVTEFTWKFVIISKNLSEILLSDIYRIARIISKNDEDMVKIIAI